MRIAWSTNRLGDIAKVKYGFTTKASYETDGPKFLRITDIQNGGVDWNTVPFCKEIGNADSLKYQLQDGDIVFARTGATTGKSFLVTEPPEAVFASYLIRVQLVNEGILPRFLYQYFQSKTYWDKIQAGVTGSAQGGFNATKLSNLEIPTPPLPEQKCIVAILDEAFEGIDTAIANAEKNLQNARELFESYLKSVFIQRREEWKVKTVGEVGEHSLGKMLDKQKNKGEYEPYLRNVNVRWFNFDLSDLLEMRFLSAEKERYTVIKDDLVICEGGYPGRAAIWKEDYPIYIQKALHRVRFEQPEYSVWLMYFLYLSHTIGDLKDYFTGAGIQHFTGKSLHRFLFPIAPISEMRLILKKIKKLEGETKLLEEIYQQKLDGLTELKQSILQKAFSGELTQKAA